MRYEKVWQFIHKSQLGSYIYIQLRVAKTFIYNYLHFLDQILTNLYPALSNIFEVVISFRGSGGGRPNQNAKFGNHCNAQRHKITTFYNLNIFNIPTKTYFVRDHFKQFLDKHHSLHRTNY